MTPTAISHQIRLLEEHCGVPLFKRRPRPLSLTWAGEQLFPVIRNGFDNFAKALSSVRAGTEEGRLRLTATNAFAARWLVPRLSLWRAAHPSLRLDIVGTDAVLNLKSGEADIAIRYADAAPTDLVSFELTRDRFYVVGRPSFAADRTAALTPTQLAVRPLIECEWPPTTIGAPTWSNWAAAARKAYRRVPALENLVALSFREESNGIEAVIAGQGIGICSDVLIGKELANGTLMRLSEISLPGFGLYLVYRINHPKEASIKLFLKWAQAA